MSLRAAVTLLTSELVTAEKRPELYRLLHYEPGLDTLEWNEAARREFDSLISEIYQAGRRSLGMAALRAIDNALKER
jgi:hypothetical protein